MDSKNVTLINKDHIDQEKNSKETKHTCTICQKCFPHKSRLDLHLLRHSGKKPYECPTCLKQFREKRVLNVHVRVHSGEKPHTCPKCSKKFTQKEHMTTHLQLHSDEKPFVCPECSRQFKLKSYLIQHMLTHTKEKHFGCPTCLKKFSRKYDLTKHMLIHSGTKPYECPVCHKLFTQKEHMNAHLTIHSEEKPFACTVCSSQFKQKCYLNDHMLIHSGNKRFECVTCSKKFRRRNDLNTHTMRVHSSNKPLKGTKRNKKLLQISGVDDIHVGEFPCTTSVHSGEESLTCNTCKTDFVHKNDLINHLSDEGLICHTKIHSIMKHDISELRHNLEQTSLPIDRSTYESGYPTVRYIDEIVKEENYDDLKPSKSNFCFEVPIIKQEMNSSEDLSDSRIPSCSYQDIAVKEEPTEISRQ